VQQRTVDTPNGRFECLVVGERGPLALCVHGFPDTAHTWRFLLPELAERGFRAVAPFTRGYAPSFVAGDGVYQLGALVDDVNQLHEALAGDGDAVIVGHDWGASTAYGAAAHEPDRWRRVVGLAVPPGNALAQAVLTDLDQLQRSWYMFLFQHALADLIVPADDFAFVTRLWAQWSPGYDAGIDIDHVRHALGEPANLVAALGYYRAMLGTGPRDDRFGAAQRAAGLVPPQPTLYLHGRTDGCVGIDVAEAAAGTLPVHVVTELVDAAGHFLHLERPDVVTPMIVEFTSA